MLGSWPYEKMFHIPSSDQGNTSDKEITFFSNHNPTSLKDCDSFLSSQDAFFYLILTLISMLVLFMLVYFPSVTDVGGIHFGLSLSVLLFFKRHFIDYLFFSNLN